MIAVFIVLSLLNPTADDTLDDLVERLICRLEISVSAGVMPLDFSSDGRLLTELPSTEDDYSLELFQQNITGSKSEPAHRGKFSKAGLQSMLQGDAPGQLWNSHFLAVRSGAVPVLAVRFSASTPQSQIMNLFGNSLRNRIDRHSMFRINRSLSIGAQKEYLTEGECADIRQQLLSTGVTALLNCVLHYQNDQLVVICQIINQLPENDSVVSFKAPVTVDLALLMQMQTDSTGVGEESVYAKVPLGSLALAIAAINVDSDNDDELAVLYPSELHIFKIQNGRFSLLRSVSLNILERSPQPTRVPTARMFAADYNRDGKQDLMCSFNMLRSGFVVYPSLGFQVEHTSFQPLAIVNDNERVQLFSTDYRPGEDTYLNRTNVIDYFGNTLERLEIPSMRNLFSLDSQGNRFVVWTDERAVGIFQSTSGVSQIENIAYTQLEAIFTAPDKFPNAVIFVVKKANSEVQDSFGDEIHAIGLEQITATGKGSILTQLDINDLTVYNSGGTSQDFIVAMGRDISGSMYFELFRMPNSWRRGE